MIKVLHILTDSNIGGAGKWVETYLKSYDKTLIEPALVIPDGSAVKDLLDDVDAKVMEADIAPDKSLDFKSIGVIRKIIKAGDYDIVHAHGSASARIASKFLCKTVFTKHTMSTIKGGVYGLFEKLLYRLLGGYAIAVSKTAYNNLIDLGIKPSKISIVYNGVSDIKIPTAEQKLDCKKSFGVDANKVLVGIVARFEKEKDYPTFLNAAKIALSHNDKIAFLLCGAGSQLIPMRQYARRLGIQSSCVFVGQLVDIDRAYHAMDIYCITSIVESFGLTLAEAFAAGVPAVATKAAGLCEVAGDEQTALMCDIGNAEQVASSILKIAGDNQFAKSLAERARIRYEDNFADTTFSHNLEAVYKKIVANKKGSDK
jgi:glycosyltransferase, family 1